MPDVGHHLPCFFSPSFLESIEKGRNDFIYTMLLKLKTPCIMLASMNIVENYTDINFKDFTDKTYRLLLVFWHIFVVAFSLTTWPGRILNKRLKEIWKEMCFKVPVITVKGGLLRFRHLNSESEKLVILVAAHDFTARHILFQREHCSGMDIFYNHVNSLPSFYPRKCCF